MALVVLRVVALSALLILVVLVLSLVSRWLRSRRLDSEFDHGAGEGLTRQAYIDQGLAEFDRSVRKRTLLVIVGIPLIVVALLSTIAN